MPFEITKDEMELINKFLTDEFYIRKFGNKAAAMLATNELR